MTDKIGRGRPKAIPIDVSQLRGARELRQLSQSALADRTRLGHRTLQRIESEGKASRETIRALCEVLSIPVDSLIRSEGAEVAARLHALGLGVPRASALFVGREDEAARLSALIECRGRMCVVVGPPGAGKSTLVQHVFAQLGTGYASRVVWAEPGGDWSTDQVAAIQTDIARAFGFEAKLPRSRACTSEQVAEAFRRNFWNASRVLVVDGIDDPQVVSRFWQPGDAGSLLVTTTHRHVAQVFDADVIELSALVLPASRQLLERFVPPARLDADPGGTARLIESTAGCARQLCIAGTRLQRETLTSPGSYAARIGRGDEVAVKSQDRNALAVAQSEKLATLVSSGAWALFAKLTVFGVEAFPLAWIGPMFGLDEETVSTCVSELVDVFFARIAGHGEGGAPLIALDRCCSWLHPRLSNCVERSSAESQIDAYLGREIRRLSAQRGNALWQWHEQHKGVIAQRIDALMARARSGVTPS